MKRPTTHETENFIAALIEHASFEPLEVGKEYPYRNHTGPGSYTQESAVCYARHIQRVADILHQRGSAAAIPYVKDGQLLSMPGNPVPEES